MGLLNSFLIRVKPRSKDTPRWYASMGLSLVSVDLDGFRNKPFEVCPRRLFFWFLALKFMFLSSGTLKIGSGMSYLYIGRSSRGRLTYQIPGNCHFCDLFGGALRWMSFILPVARKKPIQELQGRSRTIRSITGMIRSSSWTIFKRFLRGFKKV